MRSPTKLRNFKLWNQKDSRIPDYFRKLFERPKFEDVQQKENPNFQTIFENL